MTISHMISRNSITVNFDGQTHTVLATDVSTFEAAKLALKEGREEDLKLLVNKPAQIEKNSNGAFRVVNGRVMVDGEEVSGELGRQIMDFSDEGLPFQPLLNFHRNLQKNPSARAVAQLYSFLEKNQHPITEDGCFIAYKKVGNDFLDLYTHTLDNSPGKVLEMPRNKVNEDPEQTCSFGLHVANWDYASNKYGSPSDTMLEVEVNPADVVAIPSDYNESKMRVSRYKVRAVVVNPNDNKHLVRDVEPSCECEEETDLEIDSDETEDADDVCPDCEGVGFSEEDCLSCNGTGLENAECTTCEGQGYLGQEDQKEESNVGPSPHDRGSSAKEELIFSSSQAMKKMSTARLQAYHKTLLAMADKFMSKSEDLLWKKTKAETESVLDNRGISV